MTATAAAIRAGPFPPDPCEMRRGRYTSGVYLDATQWYTSLPSTFFFFFFFSFVVGFTCLWLALSNCVFLPCNTRRRSWPSLPAPFLGFPGDLIDGAYSEGATAVRWKRVSSQRRRPSSSAIHTHTHTRHTSAVCNETENSRNPQQIFKKQVSGWIQNKSEPKLLEEIDQPSVNSSNTHTSLEMSMSKSFDSFPFFPFFRPPSTQCIQADNCFSLPVTKRLFRSIKWANPKVN